MGNVLNFLIFDGGLQVLVSGPTFSKLMSRIQAKNNDPHLVQTAA
jgi:hypothetical protein